MFPVLFPIKRDDFAVMSPSAITIAERFWSHVEKADECWEWRGIHHEKGYGQMTFLLKRVRPGIKRKTVVRAHRVSWLLHYGEIPKGLGVLHKCDNRNCVRPDHLFLGDDQDNHNDAVMKGRKGSVGGHFASTVEVQAAAAKSRERLGFSV